MVKKRPSLGRGLGALIQEIPRDEETPPETVEATRQVPVAEVHKSPWQPRKHFDEDALGELVESVKERGVLQPLLVRKVDEGHELIAGERRLRAAQLAGLAEVPVILMDVSDKEALELALVENLQREDLNVIEEAEGYKLLAENFSLTQEQVAERVGKARASVTNTLRLLGLTDEIKRLLAENQLSAGHAKVLLSLDIAQEQELLAARAVREGLSVRALEKVVMRIRRPARKPRAQRPDIPADHVNWVSEKLHEHFGTSVRVTPSKTLSNGKKARGCIEIDYYSSEDLDRILEILGLTESL